MDRSPSSLSQLGCLFTTVALRAAPIMPNIGIYKMTQFQGPNAEGLSHPQHIGPRHLLTPPWKLLYKGKSQFA